MLSFEDMGGWERLIRSEWEELACHLADERIIEMITGNLTEEQSNLLDIELQASEIEERRGAFGKMLPYLKRSRAIQKANTIFGRGKWGMSFVQEPVLVRVADRDGVATGAYYACIVCLAIQGCEPIHEKGLDMVEATSVQEAIFKARNWTNLEKEITPGEHAKACRDVTEAHIVSEYGCVAAAVKRLFAYYGRAMGGELAYNNPRAQGGQPQQPQRPQQARPQPQVAQPAHSAPAPTTLEPMFDESEEPAATEQQISSIRKLSEHLGKQEPEGLDSLSNEAAKAMIRQLTAEYREAKKPHASVR